MPGKSNRQSRNHFKQKHSFNNNQEEQQRRREQQFTTPDIQQTTVTQRRQTTPRQRTFGKQQSSLAKSVGDQQKSYAKTKGPNKPSTATNAQNNPRAQLPNLDDINQKFQDSRRRQVDYNDHYATSDAISNPIKDRLKRDKLRNKKGKGLLGTVNNTSGNSVLDSYRNLGKRLLK